MQTEAIEIVPVFSAIDPATIAAIGSLVASGIKGISKAQKRNEAQRLNNLVDQMINQNMFKVRINPDGTITGRGNFSNQNGTNYVGVNDALFGDGIPRNAYGPMIKKIDRYIGRFPQQCSDASGGAKRACLRYERAATVIKKSLKEELNPGSQINQDGTLKQGANLAGIGTLPIILLGGAAASFFLIDGKK